MLGLRSSSAASRNGFGGGSEYHNGFSRGPDFVDNRGECFLMVTVYFYSLCFVNFSVFLNFTVFLASTKIETPRRTTITVKN